MNEERKKLIEASQRKYFEKREEKMVEKWGDGKKMKIHPDKKKTLKAQIKCDCGNTMNMYVVKDEIKCFGCNYWWHKLNNQWEKTNIKTTRRDVNPKADKPSSRPLTIGDLIGHDINNIKKRGEDENTSRSIL